MNIQPLTKIRKNKNKLKPLNLHGMKGFTLLEMAMVLAIIGLVFGAVMSATTVLLKSSKISATQSKEATIKAAIISFIAINNRLPCPADYSGP